MTRRLPGTGAREILPGLEIVRFDYPMPYETVELDRALVRASPSILRRLWSLLRARRISTVCFGLLDMSVVYLLALRHLRPYRLVLYLHGGETRSLPRESSRYRRLLRRCLKESDAIVAVSHALGDEAAGFEPGIRDRLSIVENAVDVTAIAAAPAHSRVRPYILYVGRLAREKDVATILRAFARAAERIPHVDLVVVGTGDEEQALLQLAADLDLPPGRVEFAGAMERGEVFSTMKSALFLVLASRAEGHPLVVIEARVAGIPAIGPRVTGLAEMIEPGDNGDLYEPGDTEAFADLMVRYALDGPARAALRSRIAEDGAQRYDLSHVLDRHERILTG